ncbi:GNAT family N-acetyltransferase [Nonomuraea ferruginea]
MLFRPTAAPDLGRLLDCAVDEPVSWAHPERLRSFLADGHYHHDRIWVAEQDGEILARAVWWGFPGAGPLALDCLHTHPSVTDRVALAAELLRHAHDAFGGRPAYHVFLPVGWRGNDAVTAAVGWRQEACRRAGLTDELERLRYAWTPDRPLPEASGRLVFREEPDDEAFVAAFAAASAEQPRPPHPAGAARQGRRGPGQGGPGRLPGDAGRPVVVAAGPHPLRRARRVRAAVRQRLRAGGRLPGRAARAPRPRLRRLTCSPRSPAVTPGAARTGSSPTPTRATCRWRGRSSGPGTSSSPSGSCSPRIP